MATTRLLIEYDGTDFAGWARQPGRRSVQEELEVAIATVTRREITLTVAGRTDSGVHAWGQVASFPGPAPAGGAAAINSLLPPDVAVLECATAADGFDARRMALSRTYCYRILARRQRSPLLRRDVLHWYHRADVAALEACAAALPGKHDFTAFTPAGGYHTRLERVVASASWRRSGDLLEFWIEADSFMRSMNRVLVGTMLQVASGQRTVSSFKALLSGAPRSEAGPTAPARGLHLAAVRYPGDS